ncbi:hypothetical protein ACHAWT_000480 [Skeletonema menzelii]
MRGKETQPIRLRSRWGSSSSCCCCSSRSG